MWQEDVVSDSPLLVFTYALLKGSMLFQNAHCSKVHKQPENQLLEVPATEQPSKFRE